MKKTASTLIISSFISTIIIGAFLLALPFSTVSGSIGVEDALFTATSAVTVTGLIVEDTAEYFTPFGQGVILVLLQIGGLGFMTFSTFTILILGKGLSIKDKSIIGGDFTAGSYKNLKNLLQKIVVMTFFIELTGAVFLYFQFSHLKGGSRVWAAIFHSISAFCNAGFSVFSRNFEEYTTDWGVNFILMILIILGGIGFLVLNEIQLLFQRKLKSFKKFSLHSKLVLVTSGILILGGFIIIFIEELMNQGNYLSIEARILSALFQSVSARTAGFNTIPMSSLSYASLFIMFFLMFVGASPGSTGGGVKTSSFGVVLAYFRSKFNGKEQVDVFYRHIPPKAIERALIVIVVSALMIAAFTLLIFTFETEFKMMELVFEVISAFGTVGLSMGITSQLSVPSKLIMVVIMFIGRIGPLTLLIALSKRETRAKVKYPEESFMIG